MDDENRLTFQVGSRDTLRGNGTASDLARSGPHQPRGLSRLRAGRRRRRPWTAAQRPRRRWRQPVGRLDEARWSSATATVSMRRAAVVSAGRRSPRSSNSSTESHYSWSVAAGIGLREPDGCCALNGMAFNQTKPPSPRWPSGARSARHQPAPDHCERPAGPRRLHDRIPPCEALSGGRQYMTSPRGWCWLRDCSRL